MNMNESRRLHDVGCSVIYNIPILNAYTRSSSLYVDSLMISIFCFTLFFCALTCLSYFGKESGTSLRIGKRESEISLRSLVSKVN
jgi:uncharacterized membrane protein YhaH (DUF805 family)